MEGRFKEAVINVLILAKNIKTLCKANLKIYIYIYIFICLTSKFSQRIFCDFDFFLGNPCISMKDLIRRAIVLSVYSVRMILHFFCHNVFFFFKFYIYCVIKHHRIT